MILIINMFGAAFCFVSVVTVAKIICWRGCMHFIALIDEFFIVTAR